MRVAFSSIAWNTGFSSPGDELMTRNTSAVAVCCSSDCLNSFNSRVFSMAMTAGPLPYEKLRIGGRDIKHCCWVNHSAFITEQNPKLGLANLYGLFQHRVEDWLQFAGRSADNAQHFARRRLLLQCLAQLAPKPHDLCFLAGSRRTAMARAFGAFALRLRVLVGLLLA